MTSEIHTYEIVTSFHCLELVWIKQYGITTPKFRANSQIYRIGLVRTIILLVTPKINEDNTTIKGIVLLSLDWKIRNVYLIFCDATWKMMIVKLTYFLPFWDPGPSQINDDYRSFNYIRLDGGPGRGIESTGVQMDGHAFTINLKWQSWMARGKEPGDINEETTCSNIRAPPTQLRNLQFRFCTHFCFWLRVWKNHSYFQVKSDVFQSLMQQYYKVQSVSSP